MAHSRVLSISRYVAAGFIAGVVLGCGSSSTSPASTSGASRTVASVSIVVTNGNNMIPGGVAATMPVTVTAKDASGNTITGSDAYTNPITLTNSDVSTVTTLSTTAVTSPATVVTLSYNPTNVNGGTIVGGAASIGATAAGLSASAVTFGKFQYIGDRFFGFSQTRSLAGTASLVTTPVGSAATTVSWNVTDLLVNTTGATFNGQSGLVDNNNVFTYTQTSPTTTLGPETVTQDDYRSYSLTSSGANLVEVGVNSVDVVPGTGTTASLATGSLPGTTTLVTTYPSPFNLTDMLPQGSNNWTNTGARTQTATGAQISTFTQNADASSSFTESAPSTITQSVTAAGASSNSVGGTVTAIALPTPIGCTSGCTLPVTVTTPSAVVTQFSAIDWYPTGAQPSSPLLRFSVSETGSVPIPTTCNIPATVTATIGQTAAQVTSTQTLLRIPQAQSRVRTQSDFFVHGGVGLVCELVSETTSNYQTTTGVLLNTTVFTSAVGIQGTGVLRPLRALKR